MTFRSEVNPLYCLQPSGSASCVPSQRGHLPHIASAQTTSNGLHSTQDKLCLCEASRLRSCHRLRLASKLAAFELSMHLAGAHARQCGLVQRGGAADMCTSPQRQVTGNCHQLRHELAALASWHNRVRGRAGHRSIHSNANTTAQISSAHNVLVLGGTGFAGSEVAATLLQQGHKVTAVSRRGTSQKLQVRYTAYMQAPACARHDSCALLSIAP